MIPVQQIDVVSELMALREYIETMNYVNKKLQIVFKIPPQFDLAFDWYRLRVYFDKLDIEMPRQKMVEIATNMVVWGPMLDKTVTILCNKETTKLFLKLQL